MACSSNAAFWSLDHRGGRASLAVVHADWPKPNAPGALLRLLPWALPVMALVTYLSVGFVSGWLDGRAKLGGFFWAFGNEQA
jgi:hypothetical protein